VVKNCGKFSLALPNERIRIKARQPYENADRRSHSCDYIQVNPIRKMVNSPNPGYLLMIREMGEMDEQSI